MTTATKTNNQFLSGSQMTATILFDIIYASHYNQSK